MKFSASTARFNRKHGRRFFEICCASMAVVFFCEFFVYYVVVQFTCNFPTNIDTDLVNAMIISDPHLLGPNLGHWFDRLRREWQMKRSFHASVRILQPDIIFILGDLFDEGLWSDIVELNKYADRFNNIFPVALNPSKPYKLLVVPGNHDLGFHYELSPDRLAWFQDKFGLEGPVQLLNVKNNLFVLVNSMAMHRDGCELCSSAESLLHEINRTLSCSKDGGRSSKFCDGVAKLASYSKPILLQHFPLFRRSDAHCSEVDEALKDEKFSEMRPDWECLSNASTNELFEKLGPRAAFSGHTHNGCITKHRFGNEVIPEYTVSSFSWRNKINPAIVMASITPKQVLVNKCHVPKESHIIAIYLVWVFIASVLILIFWCKSSSRTHSNKYC